MYIKRDTYLEKLIKKKENGLIKIITGVRRCGKSFLLCNIFYNYLLDSGVKKDHIIEIALDDRRNKLLRDPDEIITFVEEIIKDKKTYYLIIDEVQMLEEFEDVLNSFLHIPNLDVYVTGSNSRFLSTDVITEFRGRGDEIRVYPLSFEEFVSAYKGNIDQAWDEYFNYGGLPFVLSIKDDEEKIKYLSSLFSKVYLTDIIERNNIENEEEMEELLNILASSVGSLTNPLKLSRSFKSVKNKTISDKTIKKYIDYLEDAFIISKAIRYDVKGKKYISTPAKIYFEDVGLRNAKIGFRQQEENHIMENIVYNELRYRGFNVDVGVVECVERDNNKKSVKKKYEIDFIATKGSEKYYIQSALSLYSDEKTRQEVRPLILTNDSFKKIIVVKDNIKPRRNEEGIITVGLYNFLLDKMLLG